MPVLATACHVQGVPAAEPFAYALHDVDGVVGSVGLPIRGVREDVLSFVHDRGITVSSFLNAVFAYTYSRFVGGSKVYYTFTENGRHEDYTQEAVGMFVRTVPVLVDCSNKSVGDFLSGVSDLVLEAMNFLVFILSVCLLVSLVCLIVLVLSIIMI